MINFDFVVFGSLSITLATVIGSIRLRKIHSSYRPFIVMIFAYFLNEILNNILVFNNRSNAINTNLLNLLEGIIWLWQFNRWGVFRNKKHYFLSIIPLIAVWIFENIVLNKLFTFSSTYSIILSFTLVILSINIINRQIVEEQNKLLTNAKFIICAGNIIFSTYRIIVECFYLFKLGENNTFLANIYTILVVVNVFVNLLFALATLWIPTRQRFSLQHSSLQASSA